MNESLESLKEIEDEENNESFKIGKINTSEFQDLKEESKTYLKDTFLKNIKTNIILIILSICFFISEFYFRQPLFNYSIIFEKNWQESSPESTIIFFKIITKVGGEYLMAVPVAIVICFFPLVKSSFYISGLIFCLHFHSLMKIWYGNKRPFWEDTSLYKKICDAGFGNPSGHSVSSVYLYLTLFSYLRETKALEKKYIVQIILFLFFITYIILIILSRLILGIHSINQVIYGAGLGLLLYCLIIHMFQLHKMPIRLYKTFFQKKFLIFCITCILIILGLLSILSCLTFNTDFDYKKYIDIINNTCGEKYPQYRKFNLDGLFGSFVILSLLGMYLGQVYFWHYIDKTYKKMQSTNSSSTINYDINDLGDDSEDEKKNNELIDELINNWNENRTYAFCSHRKLFKIFFILMICCFPLILFIIIPRNANIIIIFIFKFGIPFFLALFFIYSFGFYNIIEITLGTKDHLLKRHLDKSHDIQLV